MSQPIILDGKALAKKIEESIKLRVHAYKSAHNGQTPILATILVGGDPASATYVKMKGNACARVGMDSKRIHLDDTTSTAGLCAEIDALNKNPLVHGILLQHPVPRQIDERAAFDAIALAKDVDGVTTQGFGRMAMGGPAFGSATPLGIMKILDHYKIPLEGKRAVVVGRSPILGKPMAMMLLNHHATVTICHSKTQGLADVVREADIVVGAVGKPEFIKGDWIKKGAVVIDAGYHPGGGGDVDLEAAMTHCSAYTPVPGGVGPMTITSLILQTMDAAENRINRI